MSPQNRDNRFNIRVETHLRQRVEAAAKELGCSTSMAARYLFGEGLAHRYIEALSDVPTSAEDLLRRVALAEVRSFKSGGRWQLWEDVTRLLRKIGVNRPRVYVISLNRREVFAFGADYFMTLNLQSLVSRSPLFLSWGSHSRDLLNVSFGLEMGLSPAIADESRME